MKALVITGAGASRNLQRDGEPPIVLMDGWADVLRDRFGPALSELYGLNNVTSGHDFEELLGELLRWLALHPLNQRFAWMTSGSDDGRDGHVKAFETGLRHAQHRGERLEEALDETLFAEFGPNRFDAANCTDAWNSVLSALGGGKRPQELVFATTNYDRSLELALRGLNTTARTGFTFDSLERPVLDADGLGIFEASPAILYLHGAVGWYRDESGSVVAQPAADRYRPDMGRPAVLYPSHNKTVEDSAVAALWAEFDRCLETATHVAVIGHGLADQHLVARLVNARQPLLVTSFSEEDHQRARKLLPTAMVERLDFGSKPKFDRSRLANWAESGSAPEPG